MIPPVVDTFQYQANQLEPEQSDHKHHLVLLQFLDVGVEGVSEEDTVLHDDDEVEEKLSDEGGDVLERFGPGQEERIHSVRVIQLAAESSYKVSPVLYLRSIVPS